MKDSHVILFFFHLKAVNLLSILVVNWSNWLILCYVVLCSLCFLLQAFFQPSVDASRVLPVLSNVVYCSFQNYTVQCHFL